MNLNKPYFWLKIDLKDVFSYSQKLTFQSQRKKRKSVKLIEGDEGYFVTHDQCFFPVKCEIATVIFVLCES